jgi:hypothetical protein
MLKKKEESVLNELEGPESLVMNIANKLSEDLVNEESITPEEHKGPPVKISKPVRVVRKKAREQTSVRRSSRLKSKK